MLMNMEEIIDMSDMIIVGESYTDDRAWCVTERLLKEDKLHKEHPVIGFMMLTCVLLDYRWFYLYLFTTQGFKDQCDKILNKRITNGSDIIILNYFLSGGPLIRRVINAILMKYTGVKMILMLNSPTAWNFSKLVVVLLFADHTHIVYISILALILMFVCIGVKGFNEASIPTFGFIIVIILISQSLQPYRNHSFRSYYDLLSGKTDTK